MDLDGRKPVLFPPNIGIVYQELRLVEPSCLHVPKERNQVALDSFILGQFLYLFQFTVANNHDINEGIERSLSTVVNILPPKNELEVCFHHPAWVRGLVEATPEVERGSSGPVATFWRASSAVVMGGSCSIFLVFREGISPNAQ